MPSFPQAVHRRLLFGTLASSLALGAFVGVPPVQAASSDELKAQERAVSNQLANTEDLLATAGREVRQAMRKVERTDVRLAKAKKVEAAAVKKAKVAQSKAVMAKRAADKANALVEGGVRQQQAAEQQLEQTHSRIDDVARTLYRQGPLAEIEVVLSAQTPADFTARIASVDTLSRINNSATRSLTATQASLAMNEVRLESARIEAEKKNAVAREALEVARAAEAEAATTTEKVEKVMRQREAALAKAQKYRSVVKKRLATLARKQKALAAAAAKAARAEARRTASTGSSTPTGSLRWPTDGGNISANVGPRIHPVYGYNSCHTGMDIAVSTGTPVRAAASGSVVTSSSGGPYGNALMLVHGDGLTTFYAHLNSKDVSVGQQVQEGDRIGTVGSTGWSTGPHLHFETRINGTAYDPRGWFGGSRDVVSCQ